jgi:cytochrome c oxidase subunit IV
MSQQQHSSSLGAYIAVFVALLGLTGLTVTVAYADVGKLAPVIAVAIAGLKATLVGVYFMHLRSEGKLIVLYALSGVIWFAMMAVITMGEVHGRPKMTLDPLPPAAVHTEARR